MSDLGNISKLKVQELRELCKSHGLDSSGTKPILTQRLKDYAEKMQPTLDQSESAGTESVDLMNVIYLKNFVIYKPYFHIQ